VSQSNTERAPGSWLLYAILAAMVLGALVGPTLGRAAALPLGEVGKLVIQLIKAVATPLLFFAILNAILKTEVEGRAAARMLVLATINTSIAIAIGLTISNVLHPGRFLSASTPDPQAVEKYAGKRVDLLKTVTSYVPESLVTPFSENLIITIILIALGLGFGLRRARKEQREEASNIVKPIEDAVAALLRALEIVLGWVLALVPFAVFAVVAKTVAEQGFAPLKGLAVYVAVGLLGLTLHIGLTYQAWLIAAGISLRRFWREARAPVVYAVGTNSSLATLPVTLRALDRLKVSRASSALGACVGTNLNNDGIVLYEGMAVLFVAQASGIELSLVQQVVVAITCMVAAMGVAGVPEAGFVSLALVLNTVGLPIELLPLLLTVDWVLARARSVTNVLSDMLLSLLIERFGGRAVAGVAQAPEP
jgi:DAACS family dicarboxylate/amino acid:cation (Na+ or H+) symporter